MYVYYVVLNVHLSSEHTQHSEMTTNNRTLDDSGNEVSSELPTKYYLSKRHQEWTKNMTHGFAIEWVTRITFADHQRRSITVFCDRLGGAAGACVPVGTCSEALLLLYASSCTRCRVRDLAQLRAVPVVTRTDAD